MLPQDHAGEWHFCRGMYNTEKQTFKSYAEFGEWTCGPAWHSYLLE